MEKLNSFEKALLAAFVGDDSIPRLTVPLDVDALRVKERSTTGSGFVSELCDSKAARVFPDGVSLRWGDGVLATVNEREEVGVVVYVDDGRVAALEGYTFGGDPWPARVSTVSFQVS